MTHVFDSGMADAQRTLIAQAITTKLQPLLLSTLGGAANGFLEAISTIAFTIDGKHDDYGIGLLESQLQGKSPAVVISPGSMVLTQAGGPGKSRGDLAIDIYIVSAHGRDVTDGRATGDAAAAISDAADPGIFAIVELVWALLFDCDLGIGSHVQQLKLHREDELITDDQLSIWKQEWRVSVTRDANMYRGITQLLLGINTTVAQSGLDPDPVPVLANTDTT